MKKLISLLVALLLVISCTASSFAAGSTTTTTEFPAVESVFTGEMVEVIVDGSKLMVHANFKLFMDAYEEWYDSYIAFMKNPDMSRYMDIMEEYLELAETIENLEDDMTDAEALYWSAVLFRISMKMINTTGY